MSKKVNRNVVYCNDIDNLISHVCQQRGFHPETRLFVKIGIDGGGSFLKVCLNIDRENDELTSLISQKKKWSYEKQSSCDKFKYSGVFKLIILAIVEDVEESYTNVKCLLDLLQLKNALISENIVYSYAFDMKLANRFLGLGTATSTFPCPWCELPKSQFAEQDFLFEGGEMRTLGSI